MKKSLLVKIFFIVIFCVNSGYSLQQNFPDGIKTALKDGNSKALANYFNTKIELIIFDKTDVYSKTQAEIIMKNFFRMYKPTNFTIIHNGGRGSAKYAIGDMLTNNQKYKVFFLLKANNKKLFIHQLRIEKDYG